MILIIRRRLTLSRGRADAIARPSTAIWFFWVVAYVVPAPFTNGTDDDSNNGERNPLRRFAGVHGNHRLHPLENIVIQMAGDEVTVADVAGDGGFGLA